MFEDVPLPEMPDVVEPGPAVCEWCDLAIPTGARSDSITCSKRCRQARWRFMRAVGRGMAGVRPLRLAYADPPYPGMSKRYYGDHTDYAGEVDHAELIRRLSTFDGWALSTSARSLPTVLALCPPGVAVAAWVRGERPGASFAPLNAWEPVIYCGGRAVDPVGETRRTDTLVHGVTVRTTDPRRVIGAKPAAFCRWVFDLLGAQPQDEFVDVFPGSGGVLRAWRVFAGEAAREAAS